MKATLALEYIGEGQDATMSLYSRICNSVAPGLSRKVIGTTRYRIPWVAEITGRDAKFGLRRQFLRANWQRRNSNSKQSRGVELWFVMESGRVYEVKAPQSWRASDRYFCTVSDDGEIVRMSGDEVEQWLNDH